MITTKQIRNIPVTPIEIDSIEFTQLIRSISAMLKLYRRDQDNIRREKGGSHCDLKYVDDMANSHEFRIEGHDTNRKNYDVPTMWGFIPSDEYKIKKFVSILNHLKTPKDKFIIDAGCGISPILLILKFLGYQQLLGIEYQEKLVLDFKSIFTYVNRELKYNHQVIKGNLLNMEKEVIYNLGIADIIYSYMPIQHEGAYFEYMCNVSELMKPGSVVIDFLGPLDTVFDNDHRFERIENNSKVFIRK